jgi:hypothetical protein
MAFAPATRAAIIREAATIFEEQLNADQYQ